LDLFSRSTSLYTFGIHFIYTKKSFSKLRDPRDLIKPLGIFYWRWGMSTKIYVGNISFNATEDDIRGLFSPYGEIESVKLITDPQTGRARGFGFVEMPSADEANKAIEALNGKSFMERTLSVSEARPQQPRDKGFGNRGGGFGGARRPGGGGGFGGGKRPERGRR
jgi:hypothetical protein